MPRTKGSKSKRPYPKEARKKQSIYKKLINKLGKEAVDEIYDNNKESDADEFYYDESDNNESVEEPEIVSDVSNVKEDIPQTDLLAEMTGLKEKLSLYESQLNEYRDLAKEHREFLAEQKALKRKMKEEAEINKRAELLAEEKMRKLRKSEYKYEADALSALLF